MAKQKKTSRSVSVPIFGFELRFIDCLNEGLGYINETYDQHIEDADAFCADLGAEILIVSDGSPALVAHEAVHAAHYILKRATVPRSEEMVAQLVGWIVEAHS